MGADESAVDMNTTFKIKQLQQTDKPRRQSALRKRPSAINTGQIKLNIPGKAT